MASGPHTHLIKNLRDQNQALAARLAELERVNAGLREAANQARDEALEEAAHIVERGPAILCDGMINAVAMLNNRAAKIRAARAAKTGRAGS